MITKDKSAYLDYVAGINKKVDDLYTKISSIGGSMKKDIDALRLKIITKTNLITLLANQKIGLIPHSDWVQYQSDIDKWLTELENKVNVAVANAHIQQNQEYPLVNHR